MRDNVISLFSCSDITITGSELTHEAPSDSSYYCDGCVLNLLDCEQILISECSLNGSGTVGMDVFSSSDVEIIRNHIHHNSVHAISITNSDEIVITENTIEHNASFFYIYEGVQIQVYGNRVTYNPDL